jgi:excisionase family DNA binding protein
MSVEVKEIQERARRLLKRREAAARLAVSPATISSMVAAGSLPVVRIPGVGGMFFDESDLDELIRAAKSLASAPR